MFRFLFISLYFLFCTSNLLAMEDRRQERTNISVHLASNQASDLSILDYIPEDIVINHILSRLNRKDVPSTARVNWRFKDIMDNNLLWKIYAQHAWIIMENDHAVGRDYKALIKEHCTPSFTLLEGEAAGFRGDTFVTSLSADGSVIVGYTYDRGDANPMKAFRWTREEGMRSFGTLNDETTIQPLSGRAEGVSADGTVIVGNTTDNLGLQKGFRWTREEGMQFLDPPLNAFHISADGSVITGNRDIGGNPNRAISCLWTRGGGRQDLGNLGEGTELPTGITVDGSSIIIGVQGTPKQRAFRWTREGGMQLLADPMAHRWPTSISAKGEVIVGGMSIRSPYNPTSNKAMAFRWTKEEGEQLLGSLHDAFIESKATHISADGLVIIGYSMENNLQSRAFRWTRAGGRHFLIRLTSYHDHLPSGINADGSIIAGSCNHQQRDFIAFLWSLGNGTESVKALLEARGIPLFGCTLEKVQSITPDGTVVVGSGKRQHDPNSPLQAWRAVIPKKNLF